MSNKPEMGMVSKNWAWLQNFHTRFACVSINRTPLIEILDPPLLYMLHLGGYHLDLGGPNSDFGSHDIVGLGGLGWCDSDFGSHEIMWPRWPGMV